VLDDLLLPGNPAQGKIRKQSFKLAEIAEISQVEPG